MFIGARRQNAFYDQKGISTSKGTQILSPKVQAGAFIEEDRRGKELGTTLIAFWKDEMRKRDYDRVMTSSQSNERAQLLYRRLGYRDCGCLLLPDDPLEILFFKMLD